MLVIFSAGLTACSNDSNPDQAQSSESPAAESQELYDATRRPLDQAQAVEQVIMDKAARDREHLDGERQADQ